MVTKYIAEGQFQRLSGLLSDKVGMLFLTKTDVFHIIIASSKSNFNWNQPFTAQFNLNKLVIMKANIILISLIALIMVIDCIDFDISRQQRTQESFAKKCQGRQPLELLMKKLITYLFQISASFMMKKV